MSTPQIPEVRWAQRSSESEHDKNIVYLTIVTPDIVSPEISIEAQKITVKGSDKHGKTYHLDLDLFAEIEPEATKQRNTDLNLFFILQKKEDKADFWPRLSANKGKLHNVRTDFDRWVDEDEQDEQPDLPDVGNMGGGADMASMMGGGGAGGMGGLDFSKLAGMGGGAGGTPDFAEMMKSMGGAGGADFGGDDGADGADSDDDEMPSLEEVKE